MTAAAGGRAVRLLLVAVAVWAAVGGVAVVRPAHADPVRVRGAEHDGYGRLVFNWPQPVTYAVDRNGRELRLVFGRPIDASFSQPRAALRRYLEGVEPSADGRGVTLRLARDVAVRHFDQGPAVIVDLLDQTGRRPASEAPAAASDGPAAASDGPAAPTVPVRAGQHDGYSRLVFDWADEVGYRVEREGDTARVVFDRPARADLDAVAGNPPDQLYGLDSRVEDGKLTVVLGLPPGGGLKHFRSGAKVVVDILAPEGTPAGTSGARTAAAPPRPAPPTPAPPTPARPTPAPSRPAASPQPPPGPEPAAPEPRAGQPMPLTPPSEQPPVKPTPPARTAEAGPGAEPGEPPAPRRAPEKPAVAAAPPETPAPVSTPSPAEAEAPAPSGAAAEPDAPPGELAFTLRFPWDEPVAAVAFRRAGAVWLVFDAEAEIDLDRLRREAGEGLASVERRPVERATVLRLTTAAEVNPVARRDNLAWIFEFRHGPLRPQTPIDPEVETSGGAGVRLFLPVTEAGMAVPLTDPVVGDNLVAVPVIPLGHGLRARYRYPEFELLPTAQGVVVDPAIDDLRVRPFRQGVEIGAASGLSISPLSATEDLLAKVGGGGPLQQVFDFESWKRGPLKAFPANHKALLHEVSTTEPGPVRQEARLDLARFLVANAMGHEAIGVLDVMAAEQPDLSNNRDFRAIRGAAHYLMGRFEEASADLSHDALRRNDEAAMWAAAAQAALGDSASAAPILRRTGTLIRDYPRELRLRLGRRIIEAAVDIGDLRQAEHFLELVRLAEPGPRDSDYLAYLEGRMARIAGDFDTAVGLWEQAMDGRDRKARALAAAARTDLLLEQGQITAGEAIDELEKLRFAWRGDDFEFDLLRRLGDLYFQVSDYRNGLRTLRQAATYFREHPKRPEVTERMAEAFRNLYLEGKADELPPVTAIALFDEFKELTPPGEEGDRMIRRLADRLVAVDLLDRAAELLQNQVDYRLQGAERARVGAKLALVRMLDRRLEAAIETLDQTRTPGLPAELAAMRRHLRARALMEMGRTEEALALLKDDESREADLLRAEMYWQAKEWPDAAQVLAKLVRESGADPRQGLEERQAKYVLNLAVALTLAGNDNALARVRRSYGPAMQDTPYAAAFNLISSADNQGLVDYRTISSQVAAVESFQAFMDTYRKRLQSGELNVLN